MISYEP